MKTEREVIENALRRLDLIIDYGDQDKNSICVRGHYEMEFMFDDGGNVLDVDSHP